MRRRERGATNHSLTDSQIFPTVARYAIYHIVTSDGGQLTVSKLRDIMLENPQLTSLSIDDLLRILGKHPEMFDLEETDRGKSQSNVVLAFELQICDQPKKCGGYPTCKDMHICKYFLQNKCRQEQPNRCQFGHYLHSEHNLPILREKYMDNIDPRKLKEWIQKHHNRLFWTSRPPQVCTYYNTAGGCSKNDTCQFLHLCSYYIKRSCKFDSKCSRSHALKSERNIGKINFLLIVLKLTNKSDILRNCHFKKILFLRLSILLL